MELFEKVEKIVQMSGCSYEDAKNALEQTDGNMLEAMILLERQGKAAPQGGAYSTRYESQPQYVSLPPIQEKKSGGFREGCRKIWHFLSTNFLLISRKGELFAKLPLWAVTLIFLFAWYLALVLVVVSLFFDFSYKLVGEKDMNEANRVMDKFSRAAEKAKDEFRS